MWIGSNGSRIFLVNCEVSSHFRQPPISIRNYAQLSNGIVWTDILDKFDRSFPTPVTDFPTLFHANSARCAEHQIFITGMFEPADFTSLSIRVHKLFFPPALTFVPSVTNDDIFFKINFGSLVMTFRDSTSAAVKPSAHLFVCSLIPMKTSSNEPSTLFYFARA